MPVSAWCPGMGVGEGCGCGGESWSHLLCVLPCLFHPTIPQLPSRPPPGHTTNPLAYLSTISKLSIFSVSSMLSW